jgi:phage-related minor tail protein
MFFLLPLVGVAVGAAVGALVTHASSENDKQAAEHHRLVANDLTNKFSNLEKRYNEYVDKTKSQIDDLTRQHVLDEVEKDFLRIAIRLQQSLYMLMWDLDDKPTYDALIDFEKAVAATNEILSELNEEPIQIPNKYFSRNLIRVKRRYQAEIKKLTESNQKKMEAEHKLIS